MNASAIEKWVGSLASFWERKDVESAVALFYRCNVYRETPFANNAAAIAGGIRSLWAEIMAQSAIRIETQIKVCAGESVAVVYDAYYDLDGRNCHSNGVWLIAFEAGECISFEQWFMNPPQLAVESNSPQYASPQGRQTSP